ncbi:hypothetical protein [Egicoccus sp. AB-alg2]|uniref:hypothetical protein n=1 Tax=Egicoccus sp. AB-alg2 TaxID=3242693 RepID=UPI00359DD8ED
MSGDQTGRRVVHDLSQAAWFGGALAETVVMEAAGRRPVAGTREVAERLAVPWEYGRLTVVPIFAAAGVALTVGNRARLVAQRGAGRTSLVRTGLIGLAAGLDLVRAGLAHRVRAATPGPADADVPTRDATDLARLRSQLRWARWATVLATGAVVVTGARQGEQQRPRELLRGLVDRLSIAA